MKTRQQILDLDQFLDGASQADHIVLLYRAARADGLEEAAVAAWVVGMGAHCGPASPLWASDSREVGANCAKAIRALKEQS